MKRLIPCIYLYKEKAIKNFNDLTTVSEQPVELAKLYSDNGADELIVFDMSKDDKEHDKAHRHGNVRDIREGSDHPQHYQD